MKKLTFWEKIFIGFIYFMLIFGLMVGIFVPIGIVVWLTTTN